MWTSDQQQIHLSCQDQIHYLKVETLQLESCLRVKSHSNKQEQHQHKINLISQRNYNKCMGCRCNILRDYRLRKAEHHYRQHHKLLISSLTGLICLVNLALLIVTTTITLPSSALHPVASQNDGKSLLDSEKTTDMKPHSYLNNITTQQISSSALSDNARLPKHMRLSFSSQADPDHNITTNSLHSNSIQPEHSNTTNNHASSLSEIKAAMLSNSDNYNMSIGNFSETTAINGVAPQNITKRKLPIIIPEHTDEILVSEASDVSNVEAIEATNQSNFDVSLWPRSDRRQVLNVFYEFFTKPRSHDDQQNKAIVRDGVVLRLKELGFETSFQQKSRLEVRRRTTYSYNMISILPGKHRKTKDERILLVGAHWDSATKAPGVDDNGSGSACLLEIARLISQNRCTFNHTIMLVWFDYEEQGKFGSEFFVNDYLFPFELEKYKSKFIGAYIMDMILVRDKENNTQSLPNSVKTTMPDFVTEVEKEKNRGDFLAAWSREQWDEPLEAAFRTSWISLGFESRTFKPMRPKLPFQKIPSYDERYKWNDFFRSDHASFWYPPLTSQAVKRSPDRTSTTGHYGLNAILLTDLGPWRKSYSKCYHSACDDAHLLTDNNLAFMQQVIDSLVITLARVAQGTCALVKTTNTQSSPNVASNLESSSMIENNSADQTDLAECQEGCQ